LLVGWFWIDEAGAKIFGETKWSAGDLGSGHGRYEYVSVDNMIKATNVIIEIAQLTVSAYKR